MCVYVYECVCLHSEVSIPTLGGVLGSVSRVSVFGTEAHIPSVVSVEGERVPEPLRWNPLCRAPLRLLQPEQELQQKWQQQRRRPCPERPCGSSGPGSCFQSNSGGQNHTRDASSLPLPYRLCCRGFTLRVTQPGPQKPNNGPSRLARP